MASQYGELRPTSGWVRSGSLGHPCKFQQVLRLGSVSARQSSTGHQPNFAALNRGRHLYSAGRPSCWASAHISSLGLAFYFFLVWLTLCCSCVVCFYCIRFSFFSTMPWDWLGRTSPKWPILCRVGCKTLTRSINRSFLKLYVSGWQLKHFC